MHFMLRINLYNLDELLPLNDAFSEETKLSQMNLSMKEKIYVNYIVFVINYFFQ